MFILLSQPLPLPLPEIGFLHRATVTAASASDSAPDRDLCVAGSSRSRPLPLPLPEIGFLHRATVTAASVSASDSAPDREA
ncbi:uncharacterized protein HKW66_Vig0035170 [Vigna angularis]|uniref:Uncharacterized protein n=1 Tax=Phaseolus angularis TaxID=3914 RepID=A0A8T0LFB7_PHAAN|nr:uncharacterized protein HKW66_Vig0035170 [Vigna angularis]